MLLILLITSLSISDLCIAEITGKQYASMPILFHQDNYDNCMLLEDEALYCSFTYVVEPLNLSNVSEAWKIIEEVSSDDFNYRHDHIRHGICVPTTCPKAIKKINDATLRKQITQCYDEKFKHFGLKGTITSLQCETNKSKYPIDWLDIIVGILFICYITMVILASFYEGFARYKPVQEYQKTFGNGYGRFVAAFSIPRNWDRLKTIKMTPETEKLRAIQGVRCYNTVLVILSHTVMTFLIIPVANTKYPETLTRKIATVFLSSGPLCVSTNFQISAFLAIYSIFSYFENKDVKPKFLLWVFINRYIRLTPTLGVILAFHATWLRHIGDGPNWYGIMGEEYIRCRKNWWTNLLYINNLVDKTNMCLAPTWYLALDTQYFIILLLIIWFLKKYPGLIWTVLGCLLSLNIILTFIENYLNDYPAFIIPKPELVYNMNFVLQNPQWHFQLAGIIGNLAGSFIGLGYGYLFFKNRSKKIDNSKNILFHEIVNFIISYGLGLGVILIPGILVLVLRVEHDPFWASLYFAFARPLFSIGVGYAIYCCTKGLGWLTLYCLTWSPTYILGRLSYSVYLVHMCLLMSRPASARFPVYVNDISLVYYLLGDLATTFTAALLLTLFFEMPVSELQKMIISNKKGSTEEIKKD